MTLTKTYLCRYNNPTDFLTDGYSFLSEAPYTNSFILGSLAELLRKQREVGYFAIIFDSTDTPVLAAISLDFTNVFLSQSSRWTIVALDILIADMQLSKLKITQVRGPAEVTTAFSQSFRKAYQVNMTPGEAFRIYKCIAVIPGTGIPENGTKRLAQEQDLELIGQWLEEFFSECQPGEKVDLRTLAKSYIENQSFQLWENSVKEVVSMAATNRANKFSINLCFVYTPKEYRGNGFAYQLVREMTLQLLEKYPAVVLNAFTKNEISQGIYKTVGFSIESESRSYTVSEFGQP